MSLPSCFSFARYWPQLTKISGLSTMVPDQNSRVQAFQYNRVLRAIPPATNPARLAQFNSSLALSAIALLPFFRALRPFGSFVSTSEDGAKVDAGEQITPQKSQRRKIKENRCCELLGRAT